MGIDPRRSVVRKAFLCPCCGQRVSMLLDLSAGTQSYIEDCEVCCNPLEVRYSVEEGTLTAFDVSEA